MNIETLIRELEKYPPDLRDLPVQIWTGSSFVVAVEPDNMEDPTVVWLRTAQQELHLTRLDEVESGHVVTIWRDGPNSESYIVVNGSATVTEQRLLSVERWDIINVSSNVLVEDHGHLNDQTEL